MPFAYYAKLSPARQRIYRRSDAIETLPLPPGTRAGAIVARIRAGARRRRRRDRAARVPGARRRARRGLPRAADPAARARAAPFGRLRRAARSLRTRGRQDAGADHRMDAHGGEAAGRRLQDVPAHRRPRGLATTSTTSSSSSRRRSTPTGSTSANPRSRTRCSRRRLRRGEGRAAAGLTRLRAPPARAPSRSSRRRAP